MKSPTLGNGVIKPSTLKGLNGLRDYDTTPGYTDTPVKWTYKAIYRVGDTQVGLWSNPVTITVPQ